MDITTIMFAVGLPVLGIAGAIAAMRMQKKSERDAGPKWRDDSLDDWRSKREDAAATERESRARRAEVEPASTEEREDARPHQRIGG